MRLLHCGSTLLITYRKSYFFQKKLAFSLTKILFIHIYEKHRVGGTGWIVMVLFFVLWLILKEDHHNSQLLSSFSIAFTLLRHNPLTFFCCHIAANTAFALSNFNLYCLCAGLQCTIKFILAKHNSILIIFLLLLIGESLSCS